MEWKVFKPEDAEGFKSAVSHASKFLEKHEELNNLMLGLLHHICNSKVTQTNKTISQLTICRALQKVLKNSQ
jgi:hypothetical protein